MIDTRGPLYIAFSSNGDMFVTSSYTNSVNVYDKNGQKKVEIGRCGKETLSLTALMESQSKEKTSSL